MDKPERFIPAFEINLRGLNDIFLSEDDIIDLLRWIGHGPTEHVGWRYMFDASSFTYVLFHMNSHYPGIDKFIWIDIDNFMYSAILCTGNPYTCVLVKFTCEMVPVPFDQTDRIIAELRHRVSLFTFDSANKLHNGSAA